MATTKALCGTLLLVAMCLSALAFAQAENYFSAICAPNREGTFACALEPGIDYQAGAAWGFYDDDIEANGWGRLAVTSNSQFEDDMAMFAAGFVEGFLTAQRIGQSFGNYMSSTFVGGAPKPALVEFMQANIAWTLNMTSAINLAKPVDEFSWQYWAQVKLLMTQLQGIEAGYSAAASAYDDLPSLSFYDFFLLNSDGDMDDLVPAMNAREAGATGGLDLSAKRMRELQLNSHCSVLIKPTNKQLWATHEMWTTFSQMLLMYKSYNFNTSLVSTTANIVVMSSYPAYVSSEDDFYLLSSGLQVMETTNSILNLTLYNLVQPQCLMSWIRAMVANRMAFSGREWARLIAQYESGTYNNQWIVIDQKLAHEALKAKAAELPDGVLWIAEQIPGYTESADVTSVLNSQGYFASYNIPFFPYIFAVSGYPQAVAQYGNVWSYDANPRANLFRQLAPTVTDNVTTVQQVVRYNEWQTNALQLGCPCFGIACRLDLAPAQQQNDWGGLCSPAAFGAVNGKLSSSELIKSFMAWIIAGPTTQGQPPFTWASQWNTTAAHAGQPVVFDFDWMQMVGVVPANPN